jgi:hypothetical protein
MADNKQEVIDILIAKVDKLMKQNEEQKDTITKLLDILITNSKKEVQNCAPSLSEYKTQIYNASMDGSIVDCIFDGQRVETYVLLYEMDIKLQKLFKMITKYLGLKFNYSYLNLFAAISSTNPKTRYDLFQPSENKEEYKINIYSEDDFIEIHCDRNGYKRLESEGLFNKDRFVNSMGQKLVNQMFGQR